MLSIIIVNYNSSKDIEVCLNSIVQFEPCYKEYEIIIVDNNSNDKGLKGIKNQFPFVKIIMAPENGGFAYGNNRGIETASGDYILLLNPDTYIKDNSIEKLYLRLLKGDVQLIGPQLFGKNGTNDSYYSPKSFLTLWKLIGERFYFYKLFKPIKPFNSLFRTYMNYSKEQNVESIGGAALMFKKTILEKTGLLDERYFLYFEENDFCMQAHNAGFKLLYYPGSHVVHVGGTTSETGSDFAAMHRMKSFKKYFKKNFPLSYVPAHIVFFCGALLRVIGAKLVGSKKYTYFKSELKHLCNLK